MTSKSKINSKKQSNSYDEVVYETYPYSQTHPSHLYTIGKLFGVTKCNSVSKSRILELGCACGDNIIPIAYHYPNSEVVGVDLSEEQIKIANKKKEDLQIKNIKFHHCSITDVDNSFGKFDYIIAHGIISWVDENVREKMFDILKNLLKENGIGYISYNCLPGWNMVRSIRDMMLYHSKFFDNVSDKIFQARALLNFVKEGISDAKSPYSEVIAQEANMLANSRDSYLMHEHLEKENFQYYFYEFMEKAEKYDLQYLADTSVSSMYLGNMPEKIRNKLGSVGNIVRTEQYMDFVNNRRFRSTLLCNKNIKLSRTIKPESFKDFSLLLSLLPEKPLDKVNLENATESIKFYLNNNKNTHISSSSPIMKAILYSFSENINYPLTPDQIIKLSNKKLKENRSNEIKLELFHNLGRMLFSGNLDIIADPLINFTNKVSIKPKASRLARYQILYYNQFWVTNNLHRIVNIDFLERYLLQFIDGKNSKQDLVDKMISAINEGKIKLNQDSKVLKLEDMKNISEKAVNKVLQNFALNALLIE